MERYEIGFLKPDGTREVKRRTDSSLAHVFAMHWRRDLTEMSQNPGTKLYVIDSIGPHAWVLDPVAPMQDAWVPDDSIIPANYEV